MIQRINYNEDNWEPNRISRDGEYLSEEFIGDDKELISMRDLRIYRINRERNNCRKALNVSTLAGIIAGTGLAIYGHSEESLGIQGMGYGVLCMNFINNIALRGKGFLNSRKLGDK